MKRQEVLTTVMNPGPFLTLILSSRVAKVEDEGWRKVSSDTATLADATFHRTEDAAEAQSDQPEIVNLGRMISERSQSAPRMRVVAWTPAAEDVLPPQSASRSSSLAGTNLAARMRDARALRVAVRARRSRGVQMRSRRSSG